MELVRYWSSAPHHFLVQLPGAANSETELRRIGDKDVASEFALPSNLREPVAL